MKWESDKELFDENKDYCSCFADSIFGISIKESCYKHDKDCNSYNFYKNLSNDLRPFLLGRVIAFVIASGGTVGCIIKYFRA